MTGRTRIIVAGGGIGGLAASLALANAGHSVVLWERNPAPRDDGAGIQIGPNGCKALRRLGIHDSAFANAAQPEAIVVANAATGRVLTRLPLGSDMAARHGAPYITLARPDLERALFERVAQHGAIDMRFDQTAADIATEGNGIRAVSAAGDVVQGDAAIIADGMWSRLRGHVSGTLTPIATGQAAFRTIIAQPCTIGSADANCVRVWLAADKHIVAYPVRGGTATAVVVVIHDPAIATGWNVAPDLVRLGRALAELHAPIRKFLEMAGGSWRMWSLHAMAPPERLSNGRIALLGDAALPVLPFLAQGAVMALEDAVTIADHVTAAAADIPAAFAAYGYKRRQRKIAIARASQMNGRAYHLSGPMAFARDAVLRTTPPRLLMARYDWIYGHEA